jgi:hypothetical protein
MAAVFLDPAEVVLDLHAFACRPILAAITGRGVVAAKGFSSAAGR